MMGHEDFDFFWENPQRILVMLAHPDDPEFFCGGTIAKWTLRGHHVTYCLITKGEKGINDNFSPKDSDEIISVRESEQKKAATVLGVREIGYLDQPDGFLIPSLKLRRQVVKIIRESKPDIIVGCDPSNYYSSNNYINHPDHRAAGQIVIESIFPAAQNALFFPDLLSQGLKPHKIAELWLSIPNHENISIDISDTWKLKLRALHEHKSQIGDEKKFDEKMLSRRLEGSTEERPRFVEKFYRIKFH